jgi:hypothetical protein
MNHKSKENIMWSEAQGGMDGTEFNSNTQAMVNGSLISIEPGDSFINTVMGLARDAGLGKFRVFLNGQEIEAENSPDFIEDGMQLKVVAYDEAGA